MKTIREEDTSTFIGTAAEMAAHITGVEEGSTFIVIDGNEDIVGSYMLVGSKWADKAILNGSSSSSSSGGNLQVEDTEVSSANPVPIEIISGGAPANMQVGDAVVSDANPVPVEIVAGGAPANMQVDDVAVDNANPVPTRAVAVNTQVGTDSTIAFANSDGANTQVVLDITAPTTKRGRYMLSIYNPSTVTGLTVKVLTKITSFGSGTRYGWLKTVLVPAAQTFDGTSIDTYSEELPNIFAEGDARLVVSNDTGLGGSDAFSAYARLREAE
mgnify:CR=1 FL=1